MSLSDRRYQVGQRICSFGCPPRPRRGQRLPRMQLSLHQISPTPRFASSAKGGRERSERGFTTLSEAKSYCYLYFVFSKTQANGKQLLPSYPQVTVGQRLTVRLPAYWLLCGTDEWK